jgi:aspartate kinase
MRVFKFGGASVKDAEELKRIRRFTKKGVMRMYFLVVSAMGKTTNALEVL